MNLFRRAKEPFFGASRGRKKKRRKKRKNMLTSGMADSII
jgi:hypothetical protein